MDCQCDILPTDIYSISLGEDSAIIVTKGYYDFESVFRDTHEDCLSALIRTVCKETEHLEIILYLSNYDADTQSVQRIKQINFNANPM